MDQRVRARETHPDRLPELVEELAAALGVALARLARLAAPQPPASAAPLVPLDEAWARQHGYRVETARKLARAGRLPGASPAPSSGKGRRRRWLVPAEMTSPRVA
jgi:hypothetical protein